MIGDMNGSYQPIPVETPIGALAAGALDDEALREGERDHQIDHAVGHAGVVECDERLAVDVEPLTHVGERRLHGFRGQLGAGLDHVLDAPARVAGGRPQRRVGCGAFEPSARFWLTARR